jgi:hypothetical protein
MGWGLRGRVRRTIERTLDLVLPETAVIALSAMRRHKRAFGWYPNIVRPKTFSEKVLHRMVFDRRRILTTLQDKYAARDYVRAKIGDHVLPQLYWVTKNPDDIPFNDLPQRFVVKPTHGSGWYRIVLDKATVDTRELVERCRSWMAQNYYYARREWVYKLIEPRILVEEYVDDGSGLEPTRYKLFVFDGTVKLIEVRIGERGKSREGFFQPPWTKLPVQLTRPEQMETPGPWPRPDRLDEMIACAETLAGDLDFLRVDLYATAAGTYVGELTTTPSAGMTVFEPREYNRRLGEFWNLPRRSP